MNRPSWDQVWMRMAADISTRSLCVKRRVGAVVVAIGNRPVATGYNGPPSGLPVEGPCSGWCDRAQIERGGQAYTNCPAVHAEINALMFTDRSAHAGGTIYVTALPCWDCLKAIANSGIRRVVFPVDWEGEAHREPAKLIQFLDDCGLEFTVYEETTQDD